MLGLRELCFQRPLQRPDDGDHEDGEGEGSEDGAAKSSAAATRIVVQMASMARVWRSESIGATLAQNDPKIEPKTMTAASARRAPTIATTKISL